MLTAAEIWRDYDVDGDPSSGVHQPVKSDIRAWGATMDALRELTGFGDAFVVDDEGRLLSSLGTTAAVRPTLGATPDPLQVPFIGPYPMDAKIALSEHWINSSGGDPFVYNAISSYVIAEGNVWGIPILGTAIAASSNSYAWGLAGVAAAYDVASHAFGAELNCIAGHSSSATGDYDDVWCLSMKAVGGRAGAYPTGYLYMVGDDTLGSPQNMIVLRDETTNPVKTSGNILVTGFTAGFSGSKHFSAANGINLLNTTFSGHPFLYGTGATALSYLGNAGQGAFTGVAGLYFIDGAGSAVKVIDQDAGTPTVNRFKGPDGSTHISVSSTEVDVDATTHKWRSNNGGTTFGTLTSGGLTMSVPLIISFANPAAGFIIQATTGTNGALMRFVNNLGSVYLGIDDSGGGLFTGISSYAMVFGTTGGGNVEFAASDTKRFTISANGNIVPGNAAALATTATDGFIYTQTCAGAPTGVPTAYTGRAAFVYDTANDVLYVYNGSWKSVALA